MTEPKAQTHLATSGPVLQPSDSRYGSTSERVAASIRNLIATGEVAPGEHLRQDHLAMRLGTTRVPVREAFKTLVAEGLVKHVRNRGHFVAIISGEQLEQAAWLRDVLEEKLAETADWPEESSLNELESLQAKIEEAEKQSDLSSMVNLDHQLHAIMWDLSPLKFLRDEMERAWSAIGPFRRILLQTVPSSREEPMRDHRSMIDALSRKDRHAYVALTRAHSRYAHALATSILEGQRRGTSRDQANKNGVSDNFKLSQ